MKIAISSMKKNLEGEISEIFGRCAYFLIVDASQEDIKLIDVIENKSINQRGGAGVATAQLIAEQDVQAVITGNVGPRALEILEQFKIKVYQAKGDIKSAIKDLIR
jgi:predicted Fe-Mo cluster-binding NifX family protein